LVAHHAASERKAAEYKARMLSKKKKVFEFEGRYDDIPLDTKLKGGKHSLRKSVAREIHEEEPLLDDDVQHAIKLR
jgi:hypothetical protein